MPEITEITETEIRVWLRVEAQVLQASRDRLAGLLDSIPPSPEETSEEDFHGPFDLATEVRAVLAIQLRENLDPLLDRLRAAAEYRPEAPASGETPPG